MTAPLTDREPGSVGRRRRRSADRPLLGLLLIGLGLLWFLAETHLLALSAETVLATLLMLVGLGLIATARRGRRHWPLVLGAVLTLVLIANSSSLNLPNVTNMGEQNFRPSSAAELQSAYRSGFGNMTVDLSRVPPEQLDHRSISINQGVGRVNVIVPANLAVRVEGHVAGGQLEVCGIHLSSGLGINETYENHPVHPVGRLTLVIHKGFGDALVTGCQADAATATPGDTTPSTVAPPRGGTSA